MKFSQHIRTIVVIAEGIPERQTRELIAEGERKGVAIIGPATVGGIKPGSFRIGNTGGAMENLLMSKLYRPGSVGYVSRSGGMSNELNNIIARNTDGVYEGLSIGGDRYPGLRFLDILLKYQANKEVKMLVLLGEVGGVDEYEVLPFHSLQKRVSKILTEPGFIVEELSPVLSIGVFSWRSPLVFSKNFPLPCFEAYVFQTISGLAY